ncbi:MAG TPA: hypothetical protein VLZ74_02990 [Methylocella sp.]|nr:hypothetical protein [Methylocella sp.]
MISLLSAAHGRVIGKTIAEKIGRACALWTDGEACLAQIHLALIGLPQLDETAAYCLFLANKALEKGASPAELMKALGFDPAALEKHREDQPRVPVGNGRASGQWTSDSGDGSASRNESRASRDEGKPRQGFVQRVEIREHGASTSDANSTGVVPGAQYAQVSPAPILTPDVLNKIVSDHGVSWTDMEKGRFIGHYATAEGIRELIADAWNKATPEDLAASYMGRVIIGAASFALVGGKPEPDIVGFSGDRSDRIEPTGQKGLPSVPTNIYVVILDSNMKVISCYPIHPLDVRNPRNILNE